MPFAYDDQNIFARILRGEIPCNRVMETDHTLVFHDIAPKAPHHLLVIPKGPYATYEHFASDASDAEILDYTRTIARLCADLGIAQSSGGNGYRMITNSGPDGMQEVPHLHFHILAGRPIGALVA